MEYVNGTTDFIFSNTAVSLGKFDGIHKGHNLLIDKTVELKKDGLSSVVFTFDYHPSNIVSERPVELIYTSEERRIKLEQHNVDVLIEYPFTKEVSEMEPIDFVKQVLIDKLGTKAVVVGTDFRFGYKRKGDVNLLEELSKLYGFKLYVMEKVEYDNKVISSSLIRKTISEGDLEKVNILLGEPFSVIGEVMHGRKIGRTIGMPTTNILPNENKLLPPYGVYITRTKIGNTYYNGITNVGKKPTVGDNFQRGVETYIFDFDGDLYGKQVEVLFYKFIRKEEKFASIEELKHQMEMDVLVAKEFFNS